MKVIKDICLPAKEVNEDYLLYTDSYFLLMDGATGLGDCNRLSNDSDARYFCENIAGFVADNYAEYDDARQLFKTAINTLNKKVESLGVKFNNSYECPSASTCYVNQKDGIIKIFVLCNITVIIEKSNGEKDIIIDARQEDLDAENIEIMKEIARRRGINIIEARRYITKQIRQARDKMNKPYGYDVLSLYQDCMMNGIEREYRVEDVKRILAYSDGFSSYYNDYGIVKGWEEFYDAILNSNIDDVYKKMRSVENEDMYCNKYPRFKKSDDVSLILVEL